MRGSRDDMNIPYGNRENRGGYDSSRGRGYEIRGGYDSMRGRGYENRGSFEPRGGRPFESRGGRGSFESRGGRGGYDNERSDRPAFTIERNTRGRGGF